jgi:hypothetical protein
LLLACPSVTQLAMKIAILSLIILTLSLSVFASDFTKAFEGEWEGSCIEQLYSNGSLGKLKKEPSLQTLGYYKLKYAVSFSPKGILKVEDKTDASALKVLIEAQAEDSFSVAHFERIDSQANLIEANYHIDLARGRIVVDSRVYKWNPYLDNGTLNKDDKTRVFALLKEEKLFMRLNENQLLLESETRAARPPPTTKIVENDAKINCQFRKLAI